MIFEILALLWTLFVPKPSGSSVVVDSLGQKAIHPGDFCAGQPPFCPEGAHVMCTYYNPNRVYGPTCHDPVTNVTMTPELASKLLDITNMVRSKVALGKVNGKNGTLPRAYGMTRLKWDSELATFAQVMANQCVFKHDRCRSSSKYPNPGQTASMVRFYHDTWRPLTMKPESNKTVKPWMMNESIRYGSTQTLKNWYSHKAYVSSDMIKKYPHWTSHPTDTRGKVFLETIYSSSSHMGCGISAYTEYGYEKKPKTTKFNVILIICNYSDRPMPGELVYNINPPTEPGSTLRCGCPPGYDEDSDCLCNPRPNDDSPDLKQCVKNKNCDPSVVYLPIITVEDAPEHKLIGREGSITDELQLDNIDVDVMARSMETTVVDDIFDRYDMFGETSTYLPTVPFVQRYTMAPRMNGRISTRSNFDNNWNRNSVRVQQRRPELQMRPYQNYEAQNNMSPQSLRSSSTDVKYDGPQRVNYGAKRDRPKRIQYPNCEIKKRIRPQRLRYGNYQTKHDGQQISPHQKYTVKHSGIMKVSPIRDVKNRYFNKNNEYSNKVYVNTTERWRNSYRTPNKQNYRSKQSIFSRGGQFKLPEGSSKLHDNMYMTGTMKDVLPRKDFKGTKQLLDNYIHKRRIIDRNAQQLGANLFKTNKYDTHNDKPIDLMRGNTNFNYYLKNKFHYQGFNVSGEPVKRIEIKNSVDDTDNKLMKILDTLEREVNNIQLDTAEKAVFDAKIRKIYGTVVRKPPQSVKVVVPDSEAEYKSRLPYLMSPALSSQISDSEILNKQQNIQKLRNYDTEAEYLKRDLQPQPYESDIEFDKQRNSKGYDSDSELLNKHPHSLNQIYDNEPDFLNDNYLKYESAVNNHLNSETQTKNDKEDKNINDKAEYRNFVVNHSSHNYDSDMNSKQFFRDIAQIGESKRRSDYKYKSADSENIQGQGEYKKVDYDSDFDKPKEQTQNFYENDLGKLKRRKFKNNDIDLNDIENESLAGRQHHTGFHFRRDPMRRRISRGNIYNDKEYYENRLKNKYLTLGLGNHSNQPIKTNHYRNTIEDRETRARTRDDLDMRNKYDRRNRATMYNFEIKLRKSLKHNRDINSDIDDPIGVERRKFYQEKLDNLERRLQDVKRYRHRGEHERERASRLMRPSLPREEYHIRPSKTKGSIRISDRARYLHSF